MNRALKAKIFEKCGSQVEFAMKIGVDESIVSRVLHGRRILSEREKQRWAEVLQIDAGLICGKSITDRTIYRCPYCGHGLGADHKE
jgi:transcriptional regulator with XRE-family HTH domain